MAPPSDLAMQLLTVAANVPPPLPARGSLITPSLLLGLCTTRSPSRPPPRPPDHPIFNLWTVRHPLPFPPPSVAHHPQPAIRS